MCLKFGVPVRNHWDALRASRMLASKKPSSLLLVRIGRIELPSRHWKCLILPLNHIRLIFVYYHKTLFIQAIIKRCKYTPEPLILMCAVPKGNFLLLDIFLLVLISMVGLKNLSELVVLLFLNFLL